MELETGTTLEQGNETPHGWSNINASCFKVRGATYDADRVKVPSLEQYYDCVSVDGFVSLEKPGRSAYSLLKRPAISDEMKAYCEGSPLPAEVVLCLCFPRYQPSMSGPPFVGESTTFFSVLHLRKDAAEESKKPEAEQSKAMRLLRSFVKDPKGMRGQLKFIHQMTDGNLDAMCEEYLTWKTQWLRMLFGFNGKPVLCREHVSVDTEEDGKVLMIYWDHHQGPYLGRYAQFYFKDLMHKFEIQIGMVVEGRGEDQQPERVFGCFQALNPSVEKLPWVVWPVEHRAREGDAVDVAEDEKQVAALQKMLEKADMEEEEDAEVVDLEDLLD